MAVYKKIELVGTSATSLEDAIQNAIARASQTLRNLGWFEIKEFRGAIERDGKVKEYQVVLEVGFRLEESDEL